METTIPQLAASLKELFTVVADGLARATGFVRRNSRLGGAAFARALVGAWLANPQATEEQLAQAAAAVGVVISAQGLVARFTRPAAELMRRLLETAVGRMVASQPAAVPLLQRFAGVYIQDSTTITLPDVLVDVWKGSGESPLHPCLAGVKVQVQWDYTNGQLSQLVLQPAAVQDRVAALQSTTLPKGALRIADLGYFSLEVLNQLDQDGVYWLSRPQVNTLLWTSDGACLSLEQLLAKPTGVQLDLPIRLGKEQRLPCRLLATRVPQEVADRRRQALYKEARHKGQAVSQARLALADWNLLVTNAPSALLSVCEALVLMKCRWQIELLFKLWKSHGQIDTSRSRNPWRVLCEVYAKLLAMLVQHWLILVGPWSQYDRSLVKAAQTVRTQAMHLAMCLCSVEALTEAIQALVRCLQAGCRIHKSRATPRTYQLLLQGDLELAFDLPELSQSELPDSPIMAIP